MFGKGKKSSSDRFVMSQGRANGNLKGAKAFGTTSPGVSSGTKGGGRGKESPNPFAPRTLKVGKNSGFSTE